jgi:phage repressor protein C with HTH and peptisase S24 domain
VEGAAAIPVLRRRVHANGQPYWDDTDETVFYDASTVRSRPNIKAATVTGRCMEPHIVPGERVIFDPDQSPRHRDMVVVTDDEGALMVKWYRVDPLGRPFLRAADDTEIRPTGARIEGVVIATQRGAVRDPNI